ncbi:hypothetical protein EGT74_17840 [Chitinophaga lutea]|uniref:Uncharacterized protein n=2 Tax=Chitinophaga lutea TaxID=2488634 RepID=A0A3N4PJM3_9BACT|nr:hypothetical protein EGT74_17840 [Chitinophaga lutea]
MASFVSTGCGSKDDPKPSATKISMKFTITVTGADANDNIYVQATAGNHDASQWGSPIWKLNGTALGNESAAKLDEQNFLGATKTYVIETVKPFDFGALNVDYLNFDGAPMTVSYKAEINGKVETSVENLVVNAGQSGEKGYSYKGN